MKPDPSWMASPLEVLQSSAPLVGILLGLLFVRFARKP